MEIRKIRIGKNEYDFINEYWETSRAWGHKSTLFKNGNELAKNKIRYYNRTWECYRYQSCMNKVVCDLIENEKEKYINNYKYINNIKRLKTEIKDKLFEEWEKTENGKELLKIKECVKDRKFN